MNKMTGATTTSDDPSLAPLLLRHTSADQHASATPSSSSLSHHQTASARLGSLNVVPGGTNFSTPIRQAATRRLVLPRTLPTLGHRFISFLDATHWGVTVAVIDSLVSLSLALLFLISSAYSGPLQSNDLSQIFPPLPKSLIITEFCLACFLFLFFLPRLLFLYPNHFQKSYLLRPETFLTLFSCIPIFILRGPWTWSLDLYVYDGLNATFAPIDLLIFAWPIRFLRLWWSLHRGLSLLTSSPTIRLHLSISKIINLVCGIICCLFTCAAFLHIAEVRFAPPIKAGNNLSFFDAFFFTFLIAVTIAYDAGLVADHPFPRVIIITTIILGISLVPYGISEVLAAASLQSKYDCKLVHDRRQQHVVVVGSDASLEPHTLRHFLSQFFSRSNKSGASFKVAILAPHEPGEQLARLLREPQYRHTVQWIRGSVMSVDDAMHRAFVREAAACFVLARKYAFASQSEDSANVLRTMALASASPAPIYVQCLLPENRPHFSHFSDLVLCVDALKLAILARSVLCPGFSTLLYLMTMTGHNPASIPINSQTSHYWSVTTIEKRSAHKSMAGRSEADVACHLYRDLGVVFLAKQEDSHSRVLQLIRANRIMTGSESLFVLTPHGDEDRISRYTMPQQRRVPNSVKPRSMLIHQNESSTTPGGLRELDFPSFCDFPYSCTPTNNPMYRKTPAQHGLHRFHTVDIVPGTMPVIRSRRNSYAIDHMVSTKPRFSLANDILPEFPETSYYHASPPDISSPESSIYSSDQLRASGSFQEHILLCAPGTQLFPSNLTCFLDGLLVSNTPRILVVVLCEVSPGEDEWLELQNFYNESLVFVKGSPLNIRDLKKAGAQNAARVVVLSNESAVLAQPLQVIKSDKIEDASTVMCLFLVKSICPSTAFVIVEFVHLQTMTFLTDRDVSAFNATPETYSDELLMPQHSPSFLAGNVFNVSLLDSLIAQAYHAPHLIYIVRYLLQIDDPWVASEPPQQLPDEDLSYAAPTVFQDLVPGHLVGKSVQVAFEWYLNEQQAVILGMYRLHETFRRVVFFPAPSILIEPQDWLFLLG